MLLPLLATLSLWPAPDRGPVLIVPGLDTATPEIVAVIEGWLEQGAGIELAMLSADADAPAPGPPRARFADRRLITPRERAPVESRELAAAVRGASVVVLSGGRFVDWYETLFPSDGPARLAHALYEAHSVGVPIVAFGGVGSFVSGAGMVARADFDRPERDPHEDSLNVAYMGLSVGAPALVDAPDWRVGDALELLLALHETKVDVGLFLEGEVALLCLPVARRVRVLGPGRVLAFDLDGARRQPRAVWLGRVSVLARGDELDLRHERVLPAEGRSAAPDDDTLEADASLIGGFLAAARLERAAFAREAPTLRFELHRDEDTHLLVDSDGRRTLVDLAFDASWE